MGVNAQRIMNSETSSAAILHEKSVGYDLDISWPFSFIILTKNTRWSIIWGIFLP